MINAGITPIVQASPEPLIQASNDLTRELLGPDFVMPRDEILTRELRAEIDAELARRGPEKRI